MVSEPLLGVLEYALVGVCHTDVELHVGDDDQLGGQLLGEGAVLHRAVQDEVEHRLQVGVSHLVEGSHVAQAVGEGLPLDLDELRSCRKLNEVVSVQPPIMLGEIQAEGESHGGGQGLSGPVHGARGVDHGQGVLGTAEVGEGGPGRVQHRLFLLGDGLHEAAGVWGEIVVEVRLHQLVGGEGVCVELCLAGGYPADEAAVPLAVVAQEGLAVLIQSFGGLLGVIEGVILLAEVVLDDVDMGAEGDESLAVGGIGQTEMTGDLLAVSHRLGVGGIDRGEPLGQQGDLPAALQSGIVRIELRLQQVQHLGFAGSPHEGQ